MDIFKLSQSDFLKHTMQTLISVLAGYTKASKKCCKHFLLCPVFVPCAQSFTKKLTPECALYSNQCEFIRSLFGFSCDLSIQTATRMQDAGGGRKMLIISVLITGKMDYNENEIASHKGCRHLLKKTFFLV